MYEYDSPRRPRHALGLALFLIPLLGIGVAAAVPFEWSSRASSGAATALLPHVAIVALAANRADNRFSAEERTLWREAALASELAIDEVEVETLDQVPLGDFGVWVLAGQEILSDADLAALDAFLASGGGVVLTGRPGRSYETRLEREVLPLERLFPGRHFQALERSDAELQLGARGPLGVGLAPGQRLRSEPQSDVWVSREPGALSWQPSATGAVLQGRQRGAPVVWLGFSAERLRDPELAHTLLGNALCYAARVPMLEIRPWPDARDAAALITTEAGSEPGRREDLARIYEARGVPLLESERLRGCSIDTREPTPDALHELALRGCRYAAVSDARSAAPQVTLHAGAELVLLPAAHPEATAGVAPESTLIQRELNEYRRIAHAGGLYSLQLDLAGKDAAPGDEVLERLLGELAAQDPWFASGDELVSWWLRRRNLHAELRIERPGLARVRLRNDGGESARGVTTRIYLPAGSLSPVAEPRSLFAARPTVRVAWDRSWVEFVTPVLDPGDEVFYKLEF